MTEQKEEGFYIGTFHNNEGKYIDEVKVTDRLEVFKYVQDVRTGWEVWRLDANFVYEFEDFNNSTLLECPTEILSHCDTFIKNQWYWAAINTLEFEPILIVNKFRFKRLGIEGVFNTQMITQLGPMIYLLVNNETI